MLEDGILIATLASRNWIKWLEARLIFGMLPRKAMFDLMYHIFCFDDFSSTAQLSQR